MRLLRHRRVFLFFGAVLVLLILLRFYPFRGHAGLVAQAVGPSLNLPAPVLFTDPGGVYNETVADLDALLPTYTRPPDHPVPPGESFTPQFSGSSSTSSPVLSTFTRQANPDRSVVLTGAAFTTKSGTDSLTDTQVSLYTQSTATDGKLVSMPVLRGDEGSLTGVIPADLPYGMYMIWAQNANGASYPVRVNAPEAWWLGPDHGVPGASASVFGRNLSYQNGETTSYVYLRPWGSGPGTASRAVTVTSANPYKVTFTIPSDLSTNQSYEVWIHNGHGGDYGWSGPLKLTVDSSNPYVWNGKTILVTSFGATPNDSSDDTAAIQAAFQSASTGDHVVFPSGHYIVTHKIIVNQGVSIEGVDPTSSVVDVTVSSLPDAAAFYIHGFPTRIQNIGFTSNVISDLYEFGGIVFFDGLDLNPSPRGVIVQNAKFTSIAGAPYTSIGVRDVNDVTVTSSTFTSGYGIELDNSYQDFVRGNSFLGNWPDQIYSDQAAVSEEASNEIDVSGNSAQSINRSQRQTLARFFIAQGQGHGLTSNVYLGQNETQGVGCGTDVCGEQILFETEGGFFTGNPSSVGTNSLSFSSVNWIPNFYAVDDRNVSTDYALQRASLVLIQQGKGAGQYRRILSNTFNQIVIDRPWEIPPDSSSMITILTAGFHAAVYANALSGFPEALNNLHLENGGVFMGYGSQLDSAVVSNTVSQEAVGIETTSLVTDSCAAILNNVKVAIASSLSNCPNWGILIAGNTVTDNLYGIVSWTRIGAPARATPPGPLIMGTMIRDNRVTNSKMAGISVGDINHWPLDAIWQQYAVVEHNQVTDAQVSLDLLGLQSETVVRGNVFQRVNAASATGVRYDDLSHVDYLLGNQYPGITPVYTGKLPGAVLVADLHEATLTPPAFSQVITLHNAGTSALTLSLQGSDPLLSLSLDRTLLSSEGETANLTVSINASGLQAQQYSATVRLSSNGVASQNIGVNALLRDEDIPPPDTQPPVVGVSGLQAGQQLVGTVTVGVTATDNNRVASVVLLVDGKQWGTAQTVVPYAFPLDTRQVNNGIHSLSAQAVDAAGNTATAPTVTVNVNNPPVIEQTFVTSSTFGRLRTDYHGWLGMKLKIGSAPIEVLSLGRVVITGNNSPLIVKLVDASTGLDVPGGTVAVPGGQGVGGTYFYVPLNQPLALTAGSEYYLVSSQTQNQDYFYHSDTTLRTNSVATVEGAIYWDNVSHWIPEGSSGNAFVPLDFKYQTNVTSPVRYKPPINRTKGTPPR